MLIPIGSWCRTAYQVNNYKNYKGIDKISYPFDWTITPFEALKVVFSNDFKASNILKNESISRSRVGSIIDNDTKIIHHHDFLKPVLDKLYENSEINNNGIPTALFESNLIEKARGRFLHTYKNLEILRDVKGRHGFVRWQNRVDFKDNKFPGIFYGENIESISGIIKEFLGSDNFIILIVKTQIVDDLSPDNIIKDYKKEYYGASATIYERKGFNGDLTCNFKGETISWKTIIDKFVTEEGIELTT